MESKLQIAFIVSTLIYLMAIIQLLRKKKLNLRYTLLWLGAVAILLIVAIFPETMYFISDVVNIETPINTALVLACMFVVMILISLTSIVSKLNQQLRSLIQEVALLEKKIREMSYEKKE